MNQTIYANKRYICAKRSANKMTHRVCWALLVLAAACASGAPCTDMVATADNLALVQAWRCDAFLASVAASSLFYPRNTTLANCLVIREQLKTGTPLVANVQCACPPGFTDPMFHTADRALGAGIVAVDAVRHMACRQACGVAYHAVAASENINSCACLNAAGCGYTSRRFPSNMHAASPDHASVLVIPPDLAQPSSVLPCFQICAQDVSTKHVARCAAAGVEYVFCREHEDSLQCDAGWFDDGTGQGCRHCQACGPGHEVAAACTATRNTECMPCLLGWASENGVQCHQCPHGHEPDARQGKCIKSVPLLPPAVASDGTSACEPGAVFSSSLNACMFCLPNSEPRGGVCVPCPAHTYTDGITTVHCTPCPPSHHRPLGQGVCSVCAPGTFSNETSGGCIPCEPDTVNIGGAAVCTPCQATHFSRDGVSCEPCTGLGQVWNGSACVHCPRGLYFDTEHTQCVACVVDAQRECEWDERVEDCTVLDPFTATTPCACNECVKIERCPPGMHRQNGECAPVTDLETSSQKVDPFYLQDVKVRQCYSFLEYEPAMTPRILLEHFHMMQAESCSEDSVSMALAETLLLDLVHVWYANTDSVRSCRFCCRDGYEFVLNVDTRRYQCVQAGQGVQSVVDV